MLSATVFQKVWSVRLVTRTCWAEVAAWSTARSALKGWRAQRSGPGSLRIVTPLIGCGLTYYRGGAQ